MKITTANSYTVYDVMFDLPYGSSLELLCDKIEESGLDLIRKNWDFCSPDAEKDYRIEVSLTVGLVEKDGVDTCNKVMTTLEEVLLIVDADLNA